MGWDNISDWENHIVRDHDYWQQIYIGITRHRNMVGAEGPDKMFVCAACLKLGRESPLNCCRKERLYSLAEADNDPKAKRSFIRAQVMHMIQSAGKLKPKGTDRVITKKEALDYLKSLRENIDSLIDEAILLFENGKYQRAGFLALVAKEEIVKMTWFSVENMNRESNFFKFPIKGCGPGFTYRRLYLSWKGLRLESALPNESGFDIGFSLLRECDMEDHEAKLKMAMRLENSFTSVPNTQLLSLDHYGKYYCLYRQEEKLIEYLRYVDLDFDHSKLITPWDKMTCKKAFDRILFAAAYFHDRLEHGGFLDSLDSSGTYNVVCELLAFKEKAKKRFEDFLAKHNDIKSQVFPTPILYEEEKQLLRRECNY